MAETKGSGAERGEERRGIQIGRRMGLDCANSKFEFHTEATRNNTQDIDSTQEKGKKGNRKNS